MELTCALLRGLVVAVSFSGLFQSSGAGFTRGCERSFSLRVIKLALVTPEVDSHLQLMPLLRQPKTLSLEARIDVCEFTTKPVHRAHCLLEELVADHAAPALELECSAHLVLHLGGCGWSIKCCTTSWLGAGGWHGPRRQLTLARGPNQTRRAA